MPSLTFQYLLSVHVTTLAPPRLSNLIPSASAEDVAHVRSCVAKVLPGAADKNADVKRAAVAALRAKHASVPNAKIEGCASWCSTSFSSEHCGKCSCKACDFCLALYPREDEEPEIEGGDAPPSAAAPIQMTDDLRRAR